MHALLPRRLVFASVGALVILAAAGWIAASKPAPATSEPPASTTAVAAGDAEAPCDMSSCDMPACAESCPAMAAPAEAAPAAAVEAVPQPAPTPGMVAYLDPETGEIGGMPPGELGDATAAQHVTARPIDAIATDGSPMQIANGAFEEYAVIRLDARGNRRMACGPDAKALLASPLPTPMPEER
jgi:hypothetical protein